MYENEREIQNSLEQSADMHDQPQDWSDPCFDQKLLKECLAACQFLIV